MSRAEDLPDSVKALIPHREPFLFIDRIERFDNNYICCTKTFTGEEDFLRGHFPHRPIVPGVILCEAAMQAGAALLARTGELQPGRLPVVTRMNNVRFKQMVHPGQTILCEVRLREQLGPAFYLDAKVTVNGKTAVTFDFACMLTPEEPTEAEQ